ncbi:MAG: lysine transporter LysE [Candidatus Pelagibacterales bacterium]|nr:MAG: lysine transporter LysE [Pelagibacterales bacterium]|tara:strand:+ start:1370 stop:1987 length:618 start_codon:yes stop_codon:yes gene_type:complete
MSYLILGFITGLSLIFAIGAQNIFVIEQGLKKEYIFLVCSICAISDFILIFFGIFLFSFFDNFFSFKIEFILNLLLFIFLVHFIWNKIKTQKSKIVINKNYKKYSFLKIIYKTLGFTYLNPHVYSDTVFFLGNFSKNFLIQQKYLFGIGASISSLIFFFSLGYLSNYLSKYLIKKKTWRIINLIIILFMFFLALYVLKNIFIFII